MREILFRGKTLDKGEWVYGNLITDDNDVYILTQENLSRGIDIGGWIDGVQSCEVIPETVGQYTGLTDKNGTRIFEGDIVKYKTLVLSKFGRIEKGERRSVVKYNAPCFSPFETDLYEDYVMPEDAEVIGNIHDNPELLERED